MARLNTKLTLEAPDEINVPLVRADVLDTSNTFRIFFEVFLSLTSGLVGVILSSTNVSTIHYVFLAVCVISCGVFMYKSYSSLKTTKP
ncbi:MULTISPECIES: hypothetical protein [Vibrio]|nr:MULTISPECIES: hypothetical protein [Vibrio]EKO5123792.1 hypothetical protein [Vibrio fluvialis]MCG6216018.1 hypothetical protein [Vibrio furnissii]